MSLVLYRKYRSQTFDEIVGQEHISSILKNAVSQDQIAHAYLFHGPRGLGKTSMARILAKAANCLQLQPDGNPCNKCVACKAIQEGRFLDLIEIDAASNRGIDQIRELKEKIEFTPTEGKVKVYIIDEVHMLTTEAFNALLKTLEEPPAHAIFILATTEIHKVPATIMSRCQRFDFHLGSDEQVRSLLQNVLEKEKVTVDDDAMDLIIENARGSYRDALSLLDVVISGQEGGKDPKHIVGEEVRVVLGLADSTMAYFFLEKIVNSQADEALDLVQELGQKGVNLGQFVKFILSVLREILVGEMKGEVDLQEYSFAAKLDRQKTLKLINLFVEAERALKDAVVPTLPLEMLVADAMGIFGGGSDEALSIADDSSSSGGEEGGGSEKSSKKLLEGKATKTANRKNTTGIRNESKDRGAEKASTKERPKSDDLEVSQKELEKHWAEVLKELKPFNGHLYAFMGRAKVLELKDGVLKIAVAFDFHKDRMESPKSRDAIAEVFKKVFGKPVKLECVVDDSVRQSVTPASDVVVIDAEENSCSTGDKLVGAGVSAKSGNIYDSVAEVFGDELVSM